MDVPGARSPQHVTFYTSAMLTLLKVWTFTATATILPGT